MDSWETKEKSNEGRDCCAVGENLVGGGVLFGDWRKVGESFSVGIAFRCEREGVDFSVGMSSFISTFEDEVLPEVDADFGRETFSA